MKYSIQGFQVHAKFIDTKHGFPFDSKDTMYHNHFIVTVQKDKVRRSFSYYGSQRDCEQGIQELKENGLKDALHSFIEDALSGNQSFEDFCNEFGYDTDSMSAYKIWRACQRSYDKIQGFGLSDDELIEIINALDD